MTYTFLKLAEEVLEEAKKRENIQALSHVEIWEKAEKYGIQNKCSSSGKTPWQSICAQIYVDMKDNAKTIFAKIGTRPVRFALKKYVENGVKITDIEQKIKQPKTIFSERDLHPLLTKFVYSNSHFHCYAKTIYHETSAKHKIGRNHWLHPDLMAVYFPFDSYQTGTLDIIKSFYESKMKLFSFEMKKEITSSTLREYYFQAVSNSSWANEGYLVALKFDQDDDFREEMQRLNNSFGIGFIQLDATNVEQSSVLIPAKIHEQIDWDSLDRLIEENPDVKNFVDSINGDVLLQKVKNKNEYDEIFDNSKMEKWIKDKEIE
jgi:hypothetical protein